MGPAIDHDDTLRALMEAGMDVARLNFSHGTHEEHGERIARIKRIRDELKLPIPLLLDTKGPEIRIGVFKTEPTTLVAGQAFEIGRAHV